MRLLLLLLLLPLPALAATVTDDTLTGTLCSDGLVYIGDCPASTPTYYIDSVNGNDNAAGDVPARAWRNLSKINTITRIGADVCLMDDSDWTIDTLTITHAGTAVDSAKIKGCYVDTSTGLPSEWQSGSGNGRGAKPIVRGLITDACLAAQNCTTWTNSGALLRFPKNDWTFQDVAVQYSHRAGIWVGNTTTDTTKNAVRSVIQDVDLSYIGNQAVVIGRGSQDIVVKRISVTRASQCRWQNSTLCPTWGSSLTVTQNPNARVLIEDNDFYNTGGEGAVASQGTTHVVIRGNRGAETHSTTWYPDNATDIVIESNISVGPSAIYTGGSPSPFGGGIRSNMERVSLDNRRILVRNNLLVNAESVAIGASVFIDAYNAGETTTMQNYYNTILSTDETGCCGEMLIGRGTVEFISNSNIFFSTALTPGRKCSYQTTSPGTFVFGWNLYDSFPTESRCRGTGDKVTTDLRLARAYSFWDGRTYADMPTFADIVPGSTSPAKASGDPAAVTATCVSNLAGFGDFIWGHMTYPYTPTQADWVLCARRDALGNLRSTTAPTIGAME